MNQRSEEKRGTKTANKSLQDLEDNKEEKENPFPHKNSLVDEEKNDEKKKKEDQIERKSISRIPYVTAPV